MKPETRDKLLAAMDSAVQEQGIESFDAAIAKLHMLAEKAMDALAPYTTRIQIEEHLNTLEEPSAGDTAMILTALKLGPKLASFFMAKVMKDAKSSMSTLTMGRPVAANPEEEIAVVDFVAEVFKKRASLRAAKLRAAQQFGLSTRTVSRIWKNRAGDCEEKTPSPQRVVNWVTALWK